MVVLHVFRRKGEGKDLRVFVFLRNDKRNKLVASFTVVCRPRDSLQSFLRFSPSLFSFFLFSRPCLVTFSRQFSRLLLPPPLHFHLFVFRFPSSERNRAIEQRKCPISCRIRHGWLKSSFVRSTRKKETRARLVSDPSKPAQWSAITFPRWIFVQLKTGSDSTCSSISFRARACADRSAWAERNQRIAQIKCCESSLERFLSIRSRSRLCNYEILCKSDVNSCRSEIFESRQTRI